jgi:hypothetical protein
MLPSLPQRVYSLKSSIVQAQLNRHIVQNTLHNSFASSMSSYVDLLGLYGAARWPGSDPCANRFYETGLLCVLVFSLIDQDSVNHSDSKHCVSEIQMLYICILEKLPESRSVEKKCVRSRSGRSWDVSSFSSNIGLPEYLVLKTRVFAYTLSQHDHIHRFMNSQKSLWYIQRSRSLTYPKTPTANGLTGKPLVYSSKSYPYSQAFSMLSLTHLLTLLLNSFLSSRQSLPASMLAALSSFGLPSMLRTDRMIVFGDRTGDHRSLAFS